MSTEPNTLFRKKPVVIEAFQLPAAGVDVPDAFHVWCERVGFVNFTSGRDETLDIQTLEGTMTAQPGDWIIKGVKGEFYPCKPDIFEATYEPAGIGRSAAWVFIDYKQATDLLAMFGSEPNEITLQVGEGHSGPGMYASYTDMPEEGAIFLGVSDQEAMPDVAPQEETGDAPHA